MPAAGCLLLLSAALHAASAGLLQQSDLISSLQDSIKQETAKREKFESEFIKMSHAVTELLKSVNKLSKEYVPKSKIEGLLAAVEKNKEKFAVLEEMQKGNGVSGDTDKKLAAVMQSVKDGQESLTEDLNKELLVDIDITSQRHWLCNQTADSSSLLGTF